MAAEPPTAPLLAFAVAAIASEERRLDRAPRAVQSAAALALARDLLTRLTGLSPAEWEVEQTPDGRRWAVAGERRLSLSLSHSRRRVAAAIASVGSVGIDLEFADPTRSIAEIAARAFGPAERETAAREGTNGFYRIWTFREALAKATGLGLALLVDSADHVGVTPCFRHETMLDGYALSVVALPERSLELRRIDAEGATYWMGHSSRLPSDAPWR